MTYNEADLMAGAIAHVLIIISILFMVNSITYYSDM